MGGTRADPLGTPGHSGTAWGHLCHSWNITEPPPLGHRLMELSAWEVPQEGTRPGSTGPGDPSVQGGRGAASVQEAGVRTCPVPRGSWPAALTIINPVRPWQLWLSLIDRVGAEVLGRAGPAASPTLSAVPGKQAPGTAPCCQSGWHWSQALAPALPWPWEGSRGDRGVEGTLLLGKEPSSLDDRGRKERHTQAMLFISPGSTPQTELSSITETQGGSD